MMTPRPGGAPDERKASQGMEAQSRLDLDFGISPLCLCGKNLGNQLAQSHPVLRDPKPTEPTKNRVKLNQIKPKSMPTFNSGCAVRRIGQRHLAACHLFYLHRLM
jgi:hypothetical protein